MDEHDDHFAERNGIRCAGVHFILDIFGVEPDRLRNGDGIDAAFRKAIDAAKATLLEMHLHTFTGGGITGVAILSESHLSIHSWPENGYAALDVFLCGKTDPDACVSVLLEHFQPRDHKKREIPRGYEFQITRAYA